MMLKKPNKKAILIVALVAFITFSLYQKFVAAAGAQCNQPAGDTCCNTGTLWYYNDCEGCGYVSTGCSFCHAYTKKTCAYADGGSMCYGQICSYVHSISDAACMDVPLMPCNSGNNALEDKCTGTNGGITDSNICRSSNWDSTCAAPSNCNGVTANSYSSLCSYGVAQREDFCSSTCGISDGTCEKACGALDICDERATTYVCGQDQAPCNDYCSGYKLVEYDNDYVPDTTTAYCDKTCGNNCDCPGCTPSCPATTTHCANGYCGAHCNNDPGATASGSTCYYGTCCGDSCTCKCTNCASYCNSGNDCYYNANCKTNGCGYSTDSSKPSTYYESGGHCYYGCSVSCTSTGWSRTGCTDGGASPSTYYESGSTCYYGCSVSCTSTGWSRTGCSTCGLTDTCNAYGNGCEMRDYSCTSTGCPYNPYNRYTDTSCSYTSCSADICDRTGSWQDYYCDPNCVGHPISCTELCPVNTACSIGTCAASYYCQNNVCRDGGGWHHKGSKTCDATGGCNNWVDSTCVDHCTNGVKDCDETGVDVGGSCPTTCPNSVCDTGEDVNNCPQDCCQSDCTATYDSTCHSVCNSYNGCTFTTGCNGKSASSGVCNADGEAVATCCEGTFTDCGTEQWQCCGSNCGKQYSDYGCTAGSCWGPTTGECQDCGPYTCSAGECTSTCSQACGAECDADEDCSVGQVCSPACVCTDSTAHCNWCYDNAGGDPSYICGLVKGYNSFLTDIQGGDYGWYSFNCYTYLGRRANASLWIDGVNGGDYEIYIEQDQQANQCPATTDLIYGEGIEVKLYNNVEENYWVLVHKISGPVGFEILLDCYDAFPPVGCMGNTDGDTDIDITDIINVINAYGSTPSDPNWLNGADVNDNDVVDMQDFNIVINNFGNSC